MSDEEATKKANDYYDRTCSTVKHFADVQLLAGRDASFRSSYLPIEDRKLSERFVEEINSKEWKSESVPLHLWFDRWAAHVVMLLVYSIPKTMLKR
jgi:hypothetical protein